LALIAIHAKDDGGIRRGVVQRPLQEQKIRTELAYRERKPIDQQTHPHVGRMAGMTG
jgi:hypothetical protein